MRILSVHNEYLIRGGEEESRLAEVAILKQFGNDVSSYIENNKKVADLSKVSVALRTFWSKESHKVVKDLLKAKRHDLIHVQNFFPLVSPSVYYAAQSEGVPVVQAVRNYRFLCSNSFFYRDGHVCELCLKKSFKTEAIQNKCYRDNRAASVTAASMHLFHSLLPTWNRIDKFIAVSEFVKRKMIEGGFPSHKISVKPNFVYPDPGVSLNKEDYIVYVGRLQAEKGIMRLLEAVRSLNSNIKVKIVGEGTLKPDVLEYIKDMNVEYLGKKTLLETYDIIGKARALVIPSLWHEPFGRVVVEAYAKGTPVIGSNMGGIPELIDDGVTGFTYDAENAQQLASKIEFIFQNPLLALEMGRAAREAYLAKYTPESNYKMMMDIYGEILR
ncbi:glycosyltransferase family 4 protein [Spirosoma pulveris]